MATINIGINLSRLPKDKITVDGNGNKWINLEVVERRETDKYGNTHFVAVSKTKTQRESGAITIYVGNGKVYKKQEPQNSAPAQSDDDLPF